VSRYHVGRLYADGNPSGYFTEAETDKAGRGARSGDNDTGVYDLDGTCRASSPVR
jgi:hypothetical protein